MDSAARLAVAVQLETILLEPILQPLEASFGEKGILPLGFFAQAIAQRDAQRFSAALKLFY